MVPGIHDTAPHMFSYYTALDLHSQYMPNIQPQGAWGVRLGAVSSIHIVASVLFSITLYRGRQLIPMLVALRMLTARSASVL